MTRLPPYVSHITDSIFLNQCCDLEAKLLPLGYAKDRELAAICRFEMKAPTNKQDLANHLVVLRQMGLKFAAGKDWSPSNVFLELREEGFLEGECPEIAWAGPDDWRIQNV